MDKYVVVKSNRGAGLGDNLLVVFTGLLVAFFYGRKLIVDWRDGSFADINVNAFGEFFYLSPSISANIDLDTLNSLGSVEPLAWNGKLHLHSFELYLQQGWNSYSRQRTIEVLSCSPSYFDSQSSVLVITDFSRLPAGINLIQMRRLISSYLSPSDLLAQRVDEFVCNYLHAPSIGVHIRKSNESGASEKYRRTSQYLPILSKLNLAHFSAPIFLASDNSDVINEWQKLYPKLVIRPKLMPNSGLPLHLSDYGLTRFESSLDSLLDMLILSRCSHIIYPNNSAFSMSSAILSSSPDSSLFAIPFRDNSLVRRSWRKLKSVF
jgi:hypothetical protein